MRRHLNEYVRHELFGEGQFEKRFFPTKKDILNHMYRATVKNRFSNCDQVNVSKLVDKWLREQPRDKIYFRPYADVAEPDLNSEDDETINADTDDEDEDVKITTKCSRQTMMFVHQTHWQSRLLRTYGNDICLLDATYKTTRYALPLFFLAVRTNVDYQVVGSFAVQDESTDTIKEAIGILKKWNPTWKPKFFMTDCCQEEINAIEEQFEGKSNNLYIYI